MKFKFYLPALFVCILLTQEAVCQQVPQFSQYMFNNLFFNPAYAGVEGATKFTLIHRSQWLGYNPTFNDGQAPTTQILSLNTPVLVFKSGFGLHLVNDALGHTNNMEAQASYSYHLPIFKGKLSLGLRAGIFAQTIDFGQYRAVHPEDPILLDGKTSQIRPDMSFGAYYRAEKYFVGLSFNHILDAEFDFGLGDKLRNSLEEVIYITAGYDWNYSSNLSITPSVLVKSYLKTTSVEAGVIGTFNDKYWAGVSLRQSDAAIIIAGISLLKDNSLRVGYSFDYIIKEQQVKESTSHEVLLTYTLPVATTNRKSIIRTPRFRQ